jgi:N-acetylglucosamine-6-sulfatase
VFGAAVVCLVPCAGCRSGPAIPEHPNIVVIQTDDQRADTMRVMPNVRKLLGSRGVTFTNSFASTPVCCPSRATFLTGQYSSTHGVLDNDAPLGGVEAFDDDSTLPVWLRAEGYTTSFAGKYLNGYEHLVEPFVAPGWDDWRAYRPRPAGAYFGYELFENGKTTAFGRGDSDYLTDVLARRVVSFIDRADGPFFSYFAPFAPHSPVEAARRDAGAFADDPPFRPRAYDVPADQGNPAAPLPPMAGPVLKLADDQDRIGRASLLAVDRAVARIVAAVERKNELARTVFVFTSDNGFLLGEHRIVGKTWAYEESIRVPLIIGAPWMERPRTDERLVLNVDLAPTIVELAGAEAGLEPDGVSLVPLLRDDPGDPEWRQDALIEFSGRRTVPYVSPEYKAIRTQRFKLVVYRDGARELYDLQADPYELNDLAEEPTAANTVRELTQRLEELRPGWPEPRPSPSPSPAAR